MEEKLKLLKKELQATFVYVTNRDVVFFVTTCSPKKESDEAYSVLIENMYNRFGVMIDLFVFNISRKEIIFCGKECIANKLKVILGGDVINCNESMVADEQLFVWYGFNNWPPYSIDVYYYIITK